MGLYFLLFDSFSYDRGLPMAAAVTAASVEAAATAVHCAAAESTADCYVRSATTEPANCAASCEPGAATSESTTATVEPAPESTSAESAVEPRASTDEDATGEVARTVITVRSAGIRVIPIVSVGADRSWADIARTDAHTDCDALGISVRH
jgi:hypothetical protein